MGSIPKGLRYRSGLIKTIACFLHSPPYIDSIGGVLVST